MAVRKNNTDALNDLAVVYMQTGNPEEAEKYFKLAIEKGKVVSMYNLAGLYYLLDRYEESRIYLEMAKENGYKSTTLTSDLEYKLERKNK